MGMAKRSFDQDMLGNTTTAAISRLKIPILSVPLGAQFTGLKHILFACDIVRGVQKEILEKVKDFATDFNAVLEVLNIRKTVEQLNEEKGSATREAINDVMGIVSYYYKNVTSNEVVKAIRDEVKESHTDLLVMINHIASREISNIPWYEFSNRDLSSSFEFSQYSSCGFHHAFEFFSGCITSILLYKT